jgi:hypothetical protein
MSAPDYQKLILDVLQGDTPQLREIPKERLDWTGPGALLDLYAHTSGRERVAIIKAIGNIIHKHSAPFAVVAQLVDIASGLDLAEVEPDVRALQAESAASEEPLRNAIANYLAYRKLVANGRAKPKTVRRAANTSPRGAAGRKS